MGDSNVIPGPAGNPETPRLLIKAAEWAFLKVVRVARIQRRALRFSGQLGPTSLIVRTPLTKIGKDISYIFSFSSSFDAQYQPLESVELAPRRRKPIVHIAEANRDGYLYLLFPLLPNFIVVVSNCPESPAVHPIPQNHVRTTSILPSYETLTSKQSSATHCLQHLHKQIAMAARHRRITILV